MNEFGDGSIFQQALEARASLEVTERLLVSSLAYIGPGPGLVVQGPALLLILGFVSAFIVLLTWPLRRLFKRVKTRGASKVDRLIVVGLDGLEPSRVEGLMNAGELPNLKALAENGSYSRLGTTFPPLSPVAWASFSTGVRPGKHGIFGFVKRERDYQVSLASSKIENQASSFGPLTLPWKTPRPRFLRKSKSFWSILGEHGVFSQVLRVPVTWPPENFDGLLLSAMGAPDLLGTQGTYTLFADRRPEELQHGDFAQLSKAGEWQRAEVSGPGEKALELFFQDSLLRVHGRSYELSESEYTPWIELKFGRVKGLAKFLALGQSRFYMTAIQVHPGYPSAPLSTPQTYSVALSRILGPFATCGLAEDMGARQDESISLEAFINQAQEIHSEREAQFFHALSRETGGLCAVVFDGTDRIQHMTCDDDTLNKLYREMDSMIGKVRTKMSPRDELIVLSDHGFKPLQKLFDLNAWLAQEGYLVAQDDQVDWGKSRAYTLGLAGLSLNLRGREEQGMVEVSESVDLLSEIKSKLEAVDDNGQPVFKSVRLASELYQGPYAKQAPDLILGFSLAYGINKDASRGKVGSEVILPNDKPWVADHCFEPSEVPGVLFSSLPLDDKAHLVDLAPTILGLFGIEAQSFHDGKSLL